MVYSPKVYSMLLHSSGLSKLSILGRLLEF